MQNKIPFINWY